MLLQLRLWKHRWHSGQSRSGSLHLSKQTSVATTARIRLALSALSLAPVARIFMASETTLVRACLSFEAKVLILQEINSTRLTQVVYTFFVRAPLMRSRKCSQPWRLHWHRYMMTFWSASKNTSPGLKSAHGHDRSNQLAAVRAGGRHRLLRLQSGSHIHLGTGGGALHHHLDCRCHHLDYHFPAVPAVRRTSRRSRLWQPQGDHQAGQ